MRNSLGWLTIFIIGILSMTTVLALPTGPSSVTNVNSGRYSTAGAAVISAIAGNVSEINFAANSITNTWQGYFGNITGTIVLGNSNNQSMYNWNLTSPAGQIYATRVASVPAWTNVRCANQTEINAEDLNIGVNQTVDQDSVNKTFINTTAFNQFYVGGVNINTSQNCRAVQLYNGSVASSPNFAEVLLSDTTNNIYTGLLTQDSNGFDNRTHDFEMIVGENGHNGDVATTPYYFYLELH